MKIGLIDFEKNEFFNFSKFVYNFCKKKLLKLLFEVNLFYNGTNLSTTYESNTSGGSPTKLIRLRTLDTIHVHLSQSTLFVHINNLYNL